MLEIEKLTWNVLGYCKKLKCRLPKTQSAFTILTLQINFQRYYTVKKNYTNYKNIITAVLIYFNSLSSILIYQDAPYQQYRAIS